MPTHMLKNNDIVLDSMPHGLGRLGFALICPDHERIIMIEVRPAHIAATCRQGNARILNTRHGVKRQRQRQLVGIEVI